MNGGNAIPKHAGPETKGSNPTIGCRDVISITEKVKFWIWLKLKKKKYVQIARLYGKNESSIHEVMKNKKKIRATFSVAPHTAKVNTIVRDKVLMKVE